MKEIRRHIEAVEAALSSCRHDDGSDLGPLRTSFRALLEFACAAAEDDLAECAEQALSWLSGAEADANERQLAVRRLSDMVGTLATAYPADQVPESEAPLLASPSHVSVPPQEPDVPERKISSPVDSQPAAATAPLSISAEAIDAEEEGPDPAILAEFLVESGEHLSEAEQHLLTLDSEPQNVMALQALFRGFHTIKGLAGFLNFPGIDALAHATEDLLSLARETKAPLPSGATDLVLESVDQLSKAMDEIREAMDGGKPLPNAAKDSLDLIARIRAVATSGEEVTKQRHAPFSQEQASASIDYGETDDERDDKPSERPAGGGIGRGKRETIRVDAERLDRLVDMVGELVITESMVTRSVDHLANMVPGLPRHVTRMDKITRELHELAGSLRMVPVRATFRKMARLVRDVARKSGKQVSFKVLGEDAELDKTLVDRIGDPLVHMIRNAIDHGLELDAATRVAAGKPPVGEVVLRALHRGGSVYIEVEDDGRGLDPSKVLKRAVERGLVKEGEQLSKRDVIRLICEPGFSTADKITSISGRGVGMDVVRQQIESMSGNLEVTSEVGKGTCFSMQLPLTLAVIDGMVMRLGVERYVVPTLAVVRLVKAKDSQISTVMGRGEVLKLGEELVPIVRPRELFGINSTHASNPLVVVVDVDFGKVAMVVDELLGQQQVVIKSLGDGLGDIPGLAGGAIMPDGRVGIVLDVCGIVRAHQRAHEEPRLEAS